MEPLAQSGALFFSGRLICFSGRDQKRSVETGSSGAALYITLMTLDEASCLQHM